MKLLAEYLEHALAFKRMAAQANNLTIRMQLKDRQMFTESSPLAHRKNTGFHAQTAQRTARTARPSARSADLFELFRRLQSGRRKPLADMTGCVQQASPS
jgi:hypothetical protein